MLSTVQLPALGKVPRSPAPFGDGGSPPSGVLCGLEYADGVLMLFPSSLKHSKFKLPFMDQKKLGWRRPPSPYSKLGYT